ncbi:alpha/beta hydrolase [Achromobacter sp. GG226]|uniref:alpha/beta hydrolase n=1 Tax=Verticiella alkaliphila TaxID=2779529 RepID=UPI001C0B4015|nr:alpha/beta hydrolase [Verticiella sp. GG226]
MTRLAPIDAAPPITPEDPAPLRFRSEDGARGYAVHVQVPQRTPPPAGFPVLYVLDGAAARLAIQADPGLRDLPVVVATVAHAHDPEATKAARAYDYTPPAPDGSPIVDPRVPAWRAGGADAFLDVLDTHIRPAVQARHPVDPGRAVLAGHSYGGLCVLHALCGQRGYAGYVSASPSIWWRDEAILTRIAALAAAPVRPAARVCLLVGAQEAWHAQALGQDGTPGSRHGGEPTAPAAQALAAYLSGIPELDVTFTSLAGESHGTMAAAAARAAVRLAATLSG